MDATGTSVIGTATYHVGHANNSIETPHPVVVAYIHQVKNTTYRHAIDPTHGGFVVHVKGQPSFAGTTTPEKEFDVVVLENTNGSDQPEFLEITTGDNDAEYLVCAGEAHGAEGGGADGGGGGRAASAKKGAA